MKLVGPGAYESSRGVEHRSARETIMSLLKILAPDRRDNA